MVTDSETVAQDAPPAPSVERGVLWRPVAVVAGVVLVAAAALGALGGWLWYQWWGPPNTGSIYDTTHGPAWYDFTDQGLSHQFDGPAEYTVIALGLGLLLGVLAAVVGRRQALAALAALVVGSALAAYLSWAVGTALSPPDPDQYATKANVCTEAPCKEYDAAIELSGFPPLLCWPLAALGAFSTAIVAMSWIGEFRRAQAGQRDAGNWLDRQPADR